MEKTGQNLKLKVVNADGIADDITKDWRQVIANLPRVPKETLETIRRSVAESDAVDLQFQQQELKAGR